MAQNNVVIKTAVDTGDSVEKVDELSKSTEGLNKNLKETGKEAKEAEKKLDKATDAVGKMPGPIGSAVDSFKNMAKSFKDIIASPIGMTLAAVAVVLGTLTAIFSNFSPIVDFLSDKLALLNGAFKGLQTQFASLIQGTGFSTEKIKEQALAMQEAERMGRDYEDNLSAVNLSQAKLERQIDVNLKRLKNKNITERESNAIIEETIRLQKEQIAGLQEQQKQETEILKTKVIAAGGSYKQILAIAKGARVAELNTGNEALDKELIALQENYKKRTQEVSTYEQKYERIQNVRDSQDQKYAAQRASRRKAEEDARKKEIEKEAKLLELKEKQQKDKVERTSKEYEDTNKATEDYYKKQQALLLSNNLTEKELKKQQQAIELQELEQKLQNAKDYGQNTTSIEFEIAKKKYDINKENADAQKKLDDEVAANRVKSLETYSSSLKTFSGILGESTAEGKALAVAAATIDTYLGAVKAYNTQLTPGDPTSPFRGALAAAAVVAAGIANVNKILAVQVPNGGGGGSASMSAPPMTRPASSFTRIDNTNPIDVNNTANTKVYVTETDITNTQKKVDAIKAKAVIG